MSKLRIIRKKAEFVCPHDEKGFYPDPPKKEMTHITITLEEYVALLWHSEHFMFIEVSEDQDKLRKQWMRNKVEELKGNK